MQSSKEASRALASGMRFAIDSTAPRIRFLEVSSSGCALRAHSPSSPEVILMDEPCSALDPIATAKVEELIEELRGSYAIAIVTHNLQQAARVSQKTAFLHMGQLIEFGPTSEIFTKPEQTRRQTTTSPAVTADRRTDEDDAHIRSSDPRTERHAAPDGKPFGGDPRKIPSSARRAISKSTVHRSWLKPSRSSPATISISTDSTSQSIPRSNSRHSHSTRPSPETFAKIFGIKMIATDLERVGDLARNIAKSARRSADRTELDPPAALHQLARSGRRNRLLRRALDAYARSDVETARGVLEG